MKDLFVELAELHARHGAVSTQALALRDVMLAGRDDLEPTEQNKLAGYLLNLAEFARALSAEVLTGKVGLIYTAEDLPAAMAEVQPAEAS